MKLWVFANKGLHKQNGAVIVNTCPILMHFGRWSEMIHSDDLFSGKTMPSLLGVGRAQWESVEE